MHHDNAFVLFRMDSAAPASVDTARTAAPLFSAETQDANISPGSDSRVRNASSAQWLPLPPLLVPPTLLPGSLHGAESVSDRSDAGLPPEEAESGTRPHKPPLDSPTGADEKIQLTQVGEPEDESERDRICYERACAGFRHASRWGQALVEFSLRPAQDRETELPVLPARAAEQKSATASESSSSDDDGCAHEDIGHGAPLARRWRGARTRQRVLESTPAVVVGQSQTRRASLAQLAADTLSLEGEPVKPGKAPVLRVPAEQVAAVLGSALLLEVACHNLALAPGVGSCYLTATLAAVPGRKAPQREDTKSPTLLFLGRTAEAECKTRTSVFFPQPILVAMTQLLPGAPPESLKGPDGSLHLARVTSSLVLTLRCDALLVHVDTGVKSTPGKASVESAVLATAKIDVAKIWGHLRSGRPRVVGLRTPEGHYAGLLFLTLSQTAGKGVEFWNSQRG